MSETKKGHLLSQMLQLVTAKFDGIFDKGEQPYVLHCMKVMHYTKSDDEEIQCIALGHDLIEDIFGGNVSVGAEFLRARGFTERIIAGIVALTKEPDGSYEAYKVKVKSNPDAVIVKMADLRHNTDVRRLKNTAVTAKDIERTVKYYEFFNELKEVRAQHKSGIEIENALYKADIERIWDLMPELRNTDACYAIHEAVQEKLRTQDGQAVSNAKP